MKNIVVLTSFLILNIYGVFGQNSTQQVIHDTLCVFPSDFPLDLTDIYFPGNQTGISTSIYYIGDNTCLDFVPTISTSILTYSGNEGCCGRYIPVNFKIVPPPNSNSSVGVGFIRVLIKCPKPDCANLDLTTPFSNYTLGPHVPQIDTIEVCENSIANYHVNIPSLSLYDWSVTGGSQLTPDGINQVQVQWPAASSNYGTISLRNSAGFIVHSVLVKILSEPSASISAPLNVCLGTNASFSGAGSTGAQSYFWDFGDGNQGTGKNVNHSYTTPGTYTVTMIATTANVLTSGEPSCCCSDTTTWVITVDPFSGPNIQCVSTLCENDTSSYWTTANCGTYTWVVTGGTIVSGLTTDRILVDWGAGPVGTVELTVSGCSPSLCSLPTKVNIPIIPSSATVSGPTLVCENSTAIYSVDKWPGTDYQWSVPPTDGQILGPDSNNTVIIKWTTTGIKTVNLSYSNSFLSGLPHHSPPDCDGVGSKTVIVREEFKLDPTNTTVYCKNVPATISTLAGVACNWTVTPSIAFTGQGTASIGLNLTTSPASYTITATPVATNMYCNSSESVTIQVIDVPPPTSLVGETDICLNTSYLYQAQTSQSDVSLEWTITDGGTTTMTSGTDVPITWTSAGPYSVSVKQRMLNAPHCESDEVTLSPLPKTLSPLTSILGTSACTNDLSTYTVGPTTQHAEAPHTWSISPPTAGSIVFGQGIQSIDIQWGNVAVQNCTISVDVELCGVTLTEQKVIDVHSPQVPTLTLSNDCMNPIGRLVTSNLTVVSWSYTGTGSASGNTYTATSPGILSVITTDGNGCASGAQIDVDDNRPGVSVSPLSSDICYDIDPPNAQVILTATSADPVTYQWTCTAPGGSPQPVGTGASFVHVRQNVPGVYSYEVEVMDQNTGCKNMSVPAMVTEKVMCISPPCPSTQSYSLSVTAAKLSPSCNDVLATANATNAQITGWDFHDPNSSAVDFMGTNQASHEYVTDGCYHVTVFAKVPQAADPTEFCMVSANSNIVCVDIPTITCTDICGIWTFNADPNTTSPLPQSAYTWTIDGMTFTGNPVTHTYSNTTTVSETITLTVDYGGCTSDVSKTITVDPVPSVAISTTPTGPDYCTNDPVTFSGTPGMASYNWTFGDGGTLGIQSGDHAYNLPGNYPVTLTAIDQNGCTTMDSETIDVHQVNPDIIIYSTPLTFCQGDNITLTAPSGTGYGWSWSTGATTQSIVVSTAGTFEVTVTDGQGCTYTTPAVTTYVKDLPDVTVSGNAYICDNGSTTLSVPAGSMSYHWTYVESGVTKTASTSNELTVLSSSNHSPYVVNVTSSNLCENSNTVTVVNAVSPSFVIDLSPDSCAYGPITFSVNPIQTGVNYIWSNGASGATMTTSIPGFYSCTGVDATSGCSHTTGRQLHPLPEFCTFPSGCYKTCVADTICGPFDMTSYQWYLDGAILPAETNRCVAFSASGEYQLEATDPNGCSSISEVTQIELIACDTCDMVDIIKNPVVEPWGGVNPCCARLDYTNNSPLPLKAIEIRSVFADMTFSAIDPSFTNASWNSTNSLTLFGNPSTGDLPSGTITDFIEICLTNTNPLSPTQYLIVDWYDDLNDLVCSDTLTFNCPPAPDGCIAASDTLRCVNDQVFMDMTVCVPWSADYPINYLDVNVLSPLTLTPNPRSIMTLYPGQCRTFTYQVGGPFQAGDYICYDLIGHNADPNVVDTALCCNSGIGYCSEIPDCMPCDDVFVEQGDDQDCCLNWWIFNNYQPDYFDGIDICVTDPNTTISIYNPLGSGWLTALNNGTAIELDVTTPLGTHIPLGSIQMPQICISSTKHPQQVIEVKWMKGDSIVCRDSLYFNCNADCAVIEDTVVCQDFGAGGYRYDFLIENTSSSPSFTFDHGDLVITQPGSPTISQTYPFFGGIAPGGSLGYFSLNLPSSIGSPGDTICYTLALHETGLDLHHINCCNVYHCFILPPCPPFDPWIVWPADTLVTDVSWNSTDFIIDIPDFLCPYYCDGPVIDFVDEYLAKGCIDVIARHWSIGDTCGNLFEHTQVIEVVDVSPPQFTYDFALDTTIVGELTYDLPLPLFDDEDGEVSLSFVDELVDNGAEVVIRREFSLTDACDNETVAIQRYHITDTAGDCVGDINGNGQVGIEDFIIFNSQWGIVCDGCACDLTGDQSVDVSDLMILNSNYGNDCIGQTLTESESTDLLKDLMSTQSEDRSIDTTVEILKALQESHPLDFSIIPNPSDGIAFSLQLMGEWIENGRLNIRVIDALGSVVQTSYVESKSGLVVLRMNPPLTNGIYLVSVENAKGLRTKRLIVSE